MTTFVSRVGKQTVRNFSNVAKTNSAQLATILQDARSGGINPFTLYTQGQVITEQVLTNIRPPKFTQDQTKRTGNDSLVQITDEERDCMQSLLVRFPKKTGSIQEYHQQLGNFNAQGPVRILKNTVGGGGTRGQLPMIADISPYKLTGELAMASKADPALGFSELLRAENGDALQVRKYDVYKKHIQAKALECAKAGKTYDIRAFDFANRHHINLGNLLTIVEELHNEGIKNINVSIEHSYKPEMSVEEVGQTIVGSALLGFNTGGVKAFAPNLNAYKANEIFLWTDGELNKAAKIAESMGDKERAKQLRDFSVVVHGHYSEDPQQSYLPVLSPDRTDTVGVAETMVKTAKETGRPLVLHATCPVKFPGMDKPYKTHYSYGEILEAIEKHGVAPVTKGHYEIAEKLTQTQQRTMDENRELWAGIPKAQSLPNNKPGGGGPAEHLAIKQLYAFITDSAKHDPKIKTASFEEVQAMWNAELRRIEKETIVKSWVTPGFKAVCDLADHVLRNKVKGLPSYSGKLPAISVDVLREQPDNIGDQEALKAAYTQHLTDQLNNLVENKKISEEQKSTILGFNLDKQRISEFLGTQAIESSIKDDIVEASGMKMRPTVKSGGLDKEHKQLNDMGARDSQKLKISEAALLQAMYDSLAVPYIQQNISTQTPSQEFMQNARNNDPETLRKIRAYTMDGDTTLYKEAFEQITFAERVSVPKVRGVA